MKKLNNVFLNFNPSVVIHLLPKQELDIMKIRELI